ncbi:hypothetical protein ES705_37458 [subsurface metagenome]
MILSILANFKKYATKKPGIIRNVRYLSPNSLTMGMVIMGVKVAANPPMVINTERDLPLEPLDKFIAVDDPNG